MKFKNKVVWITGASSGIGEALAYEFTHEGAKTILSSNEPEELEGVKKRCEEMGGESCVLFLDLLDTPSLGEATKKAIEKYGCIDILINNGGISHRSMVHETDIDFDRRIMEIDFFSYIILTKSLLPHMLERGGGQKNRHILRAQSQADSLDQALRRILERIHGILRDGDAFISKQIKC